MTIRGFAYLTNSSPGRAVARTRLRMMLTSPPLSLKFRKAGFPRYGFKAGISDGAFLSTTWCTRRAVCVRPSCTPLPVTSYSRSESRDAVRRCASVRADSLLYPRGPRSGPSCVVSVHHHLLTPSAPLASTSRLHRRAAYTRCPRCAPNFGA